MTDLQLRLLSMMSSIDNIFKKHNIKYFLGGGTALGAIRHNGFLPWDDDVDFYITRDSWLQIVDMLPELLPSHLKLITCKTNIHYRNPICRIVDVNSTMIYSSRISDETPHGIQVEFFILDPLPNDLQLRDKYFKNLWLYIELMTNFRTTNNRLSDKVINYKKFIVYKRLEKIFGITLILKHFEKKLFCYKETECSHYCLRWGQRHIIYNKEIFNEVKYVKFENLYLPVSIDVLKQLRTDYGSTWMVVPDSTSQIIHNSLEDINVHYSEYMKKITPFVNMKKRRKYFLARKEKNVKINLINREISNHKIALDIIEIECYLKLLLENRDTINNMFNNANYQDIIELFSKYIKKQTNSNILRKNKFINIDDDILYVILFSLVMQGKYYLVEKMINIRKNHNPQLPNEIKELNDLVYNINLIEISRYDNLILQNKKLINDLLDKYPMQINLIKNNLIIELLENGETKNIILLDKINYYISSYIRDGEFISLLANYYFNIGRINNALLLFKISNDWTNNGMVLLDNNKKITEINKEVNSNG
ncbi:MAG: LicD family protein [Bacilli bacterium]|jgi:phosphorylcholine metabolism protein LicD|nr:LicD family protein [Bacilli bacterium]